MQEQYKVLYNSKEFFVKIKDGKKEVTFYQSADYTDVLLMIATEFPGKEINLKQTSGYVSCTYSEK